jgi:hypothetical protein
MSKGDVSSRRSFLKAGAVLSAPLAVLPGAALAGNGAGARLARLEDENAIRSLHQNWLRGINASTAGNAGLEGMKAATLAPGEKVCGISADLAGPPDAIVIGANGSTARGQFHCAVEVEAPLAKDCTLGQMAHLQGGGFVRRTEARVLTVDYAKTNRGWSVTQRRLAAAKA